MKPVCSRLLYTTCIAICIVALWCRVALATSPSADMAPPPSFQEERVVEDPFPTRVDEIRIEGLIRTKPHVVRRELGFIEGDVITKAQLDLAITRLWNTTIFARVDAKILKRGDDKTIVLIALEDRWTLNPLFRFGSGGGAVFFRIGAADNNIAGRFLELQGQYEYFDGFHGGQAIFRDPRLFDQRVELAVQVDRLVRPRQGFSDQRTQAIVELGKLYDQDRMRISFRASAFANRFLAPLDSTPFYPAPTDTLLMEPAFRVGRIDLVRLRYSGVSIELRPGLGFISSHSQTEQTDSAAYVSMTGELLAFKMIGDRLNLAFRFRASNITSKVPPHLEIWAGGLDLLRGFPDNFVRTRALALANFEARFTAFDSTWVAFVPTAFADAMAARSPVGPAGTAISVGAGLRVLIPKFVGSGLRADLAIPVQSDLREVSVIDQARGFGPVTPRADIGSLQPSFGVYQFF